MHRTLDPTPPNNLKLAIQLHFCVFWGQPPTLRPGIPSVGSGQVWCKKKSGMAQAQAQGLGLGITLGTVGARASGQAARAAESEGARPGAVLPEPLLDAGRGERPGVLRGVPPAPPDPRLPDTTRREFLGVKGHVIAKHRSTARE